MLSRMNEASYLGFFHPFGIALSLQLQPRSGLPDVSNLAEKTGKDKTESAKRSIKIQLTRGVGLEDEEEPRSAE